MFKFLMLLLFLAMIVGFQNLQEQIDTLKEQVQMNDVTKDLLLNEYRSYYFK